MFREVRKFSALKAIIALLTIFPCFDLALAQQSGGAGQYIVGFEDDWSERLREAVPGLDAYTDEQLKKAVVQGLGADSSLSDNLELIDAQVGEIPPGQVMDSAYAEVLISRGIVSYIEPDQVVRVVDVTPNDPSFNLLHGLKNATNGNHDIDATDAWAKTTGSSDVVVGVIDTGIDWNHPDLSPNIWRNTGEIAANGIDDDGNGYVDDIYGWNGITNSGNALDDHGHGTHCAGTIGAAGNNGIGVTGVAWDVQLMPLKFLSAGGSGMTSDAIKVIDYAVTMRNRGVNIRVLSNSWGGGGYSVSLYNAIERAKNAGILFVAAAGNNATNNDSNPHYPSNYSNTNIISVASTDSLGRLSSFSNFGLSTVHLGAPGSAIYSTYPNNSYRSLSGTSMATPHVAGVAALILSSRPSMTLADLKSQLLSTTRPLSSLSGKTITGGLLNANLAVPTPGGNGLPRISPIANISMSTSVNLVNVSINASDPEGASVSLSAAITPAIVGSPNVQLSLSGSTLTINPDNGYAGTFTVAVTASDGIDTTTRTFQVEVKNYAPTLSAISDRVTTGAASPLLVPLSASDQENDPITYSAALQSVEQYAHSLDQRYDFYQSGGTFWDNWAGLGEKWFRGSLQGGDWFVVFPNGQLIRFVESFEDSEVLGTFGPEYHVNPTKFFNVTAPAAFSGSVSIQGSQVRLVYPAGFRGHFFVSVTATATGGSASRRFQVTVRNSPPVLSAISNRIVAPGQSSTVTLVATDADNDSLTYSASVKSVRRLAYELDQRFDLYKVGRTFFENGAGEGQNERWIRAQRDGAPYLIILPSGSVRRWVGSVAASPEVARLTPDYYVNPALLFDVAAPAVSGIRLTLSGTQLTLDAARGFAGDNEVLVSVSDGSDVDTKVFRVRVTSRSILASGASDSDGDGVYDEQEVVDGTDPYDSGSLKQVLEGSIYTMWNGFLRMTNILELVNATEDSQSISLSFYDIQGNLRDSRFFEIGARGQLDVIVNELNGFERNSYGLIKLESSGRLEGRMFFYRPDAMNGYEFAYGVPLGKGTQGTSAVAFNTFQPSLDGRDRESVVANWLSVVNLENSTKCFQIRTHRINGELLQSRNMNVPAFGRVDVDGGHGIAGRSVVGLHVIVPCDETAAYLAQIVRYGTKQDSTYSFAFPLMARAATNKALHLPISRQFGEQTWLEISNGSAAPASVMVRLYGASGDLREERLLTLSSYSQVHLDTFSYLDTAEVGSAVVTPLDSSAVLAQAMYYFRSDENGAIEAMYGIQGEEALGLSKTGSYNLFLDMSNWLILKNPTNTPKVVRLRVNSPEAFAEESVTLPADGTVVLPIHQFDRFQAPTDSYGTVAIDTDESPIVSQLIRMRRIGNSVDFAAPTTVR